MFTVVLSKYLVVSEGKILIVVTVTVAARTAVNIDRRPFQITDIGQSAADHRRVRAAAPLGALLLDVAVARLGDGGYASILAAALDPLVRVLVKSRKVLPQLLVLSGDLVTFAHGGKPERQGSEGLRVKLVLV